MLLMVEKMMYFSGMYLISVVFQIVSNGCQRLDGQPLCCSSLNEKVVDLKKRNLEALLSLFYKHIVAHCILQASWIFSVKLPILPILSFQIPVSPEKVVEKSTGWLHKI